MNENSTQIGSQSAGKRPLVLPTGRLVAASVLVAAVAGVILWGLLPLVRPNAGLGIALGVAAGGLGSIAGVLLVKPWRSRPVAMWPTMLLAAQGIGFFGTLFVSGLLYSTTRPDPLGLAAGSVLSFVGAVIGHARVFASCVRSVGPSADSSGTP